MPQEKYILEMKNIVKLFPGVRALDGVNLRIKKGEVHALMGENGAGKSTLMNVLLGVLNRDEGEIFYKGEPVHFKSPHDALTSGISMIHQEISLIPSVDVAENIWIGRESKYKKAGLISKKMRYEATYRLLDELGIDIDPHRLVQRLSVAQMQLVELARAVSYEPSIIIMDEPTSSLSENEISLLYKIIRDLSSKGTSVIFISHKLDEIYEICTHVTILRDGKYIADHPLEDLPTEQIIKYIAGREVSNIFPKVKCEIKDVVLEVKNLTAVGRFYDVNFSVRAGEILGVSGLVGAGRSEVMRAVFGIDKFDSGQVLINGQPVKIKSPKHAISLNMGMVTEDRLYTGIVSNMSVSSNISLAYLNTISKMGFIDHKTEIIDTGEVSEQLDIKASSPKQKTGSLSGGNQQKVIIAKWLLTQPKILILDEPTKGIDVGSKSEIHRIISELAGQGMAVIMVSSEMPEIMGMSDSILVMREGRVTCKFNTKDVTHEDVVSACFGR